MFRGFRLLLTMLSLGIVFAVASVSVAAQGSLISSPIAVATNAGTPFAAAGFRSGELVSLWTTAPDSTVAPLPSTTADTQGTISATVSFPTAGIWNITAHGQTSGIEVVGTYTVGTTSGAPTTGGTPGIPAPAAVAQGNPALFAPPAGATGAYPQVAIGAPVVFQGAGFATNEALAFWETAPDSTVSPLQANSTLSQTGAFTMNISFPSPGFWQVTAHGLTTGREVIGRYIVTSNNGTAQVPVSGAPSYSVGSTLPVPVGATAPTGTTPATTTIGSSVSFTATGFSASERVSAWITAPDTSTHPLNQANADGSGTVNIVTAFPSAGQWQITAHGLDSGREVIGQYQVTAP